MPTAEHLLERSAELQCCGEVERLYSTSHTSLETSGESIS